MVIGIVVIDMLCIECFFVQSSYNRFDKIDVRTFCKIPRVNITTATKSPSLYLVFQKEWTLGSSKGFTIKYFLMNNI